MTYKCNGRSGEPKQFVQIHDYQNLLEDIDVGDRSLYEIKIDTWNIDNTICVGCKNSVINEWNSVLDYIPKPALLHKINILEWSEPPLTITLYLLDIKTIGMHNKCCQKVLNQRLRGF